MPTDPSAAADHPSSFDLTVDGQACTVAGPAMRPLVAALREELGITGPKLVCGIGMCGACSVLLDGTLVSGCLVPVALAAGRTVTTVAGLTPPDGLSPLQAACVEHGAAQCGYCTPGQVVAATALLAEEPSPDRAEIADWMAGNLCRCTGYGAILDAVESVAGVQG